MRWVAAVAVVCACSSNAKTPIGTAALPERAVQPADDPPRPAFRLPTHFIPASYAARVAIDPAKPTFAGHIEITGDLAKPARVIWLHGRDLTIHAASANGASTVSLVATTKDDLIELRPATPLPAGRWVIAIDYTGLIVPDGVSGAFKTMDGSNAYVVTQFEPTAARSVFPCLDEPSFKVPWQLTIDVPAKLVAVSNTPALHTTAIDADHARVEFAPTRPLPSYLLAFAVGPWELVDAGKSKSGVPLRVIVPRGRTAEAAYLAAKMPAIVDFLEGWFEIPFPYPKLDVVATGLGLGGMENAGLVIANTRFALVDPSHPSWSERFEVLDTIGHEITHEWFGDLVTCAWWNDGWLNEGFAVWMEDRLLAAIEPSWRAADQGVSRRRWAFELDSVPTAARIHQSVDNAEQIDSAFGWLAYEKTSSVLRMFEHYLGADKTRRAIHDYLVEHVDKTATADQLLATFGNVGGANVVAGFRDFLDQPGMPVIATVLSCAPGAKPSLAVTQHPYRMTDATKTATWKVPVCVAYDRHGQRAEICSLIESSTATIALDTDTCPKWTFADAGAYGYYRVALTEPEAAKLRDVTWPNLTKLERRSAFEAVRSHAIDSELPVAILASFVPKLLADDDRFATGDALGDAVSGVFGWYAWSLSRAQGMPAGVSSAIPPPLLAAARARVRTIIAPLVARYRLTAGPHDDLDAEVRRRDVISSAVWARDHSLDRQALALASHYRDLTRGQRALILPLAVNASTELASRLQADLMTETDPHVKADIIAGLAASHDPAVIRNSLSIVLDRRVPNGIWLLAYADEDGRAIIEAGIREHLHELEQRFPVRDGDYGAEFFGLLNVLVGACDPVRRDELAGYMTTHFAKLPGGQFPVTQSLAALDDCIATRMRLEPSLRAWLK